MQSATFFKLLLALLLMAFGSELVAQSATGGLIQAAPDRTLKEWLTRMHEASRRRDYVGTFVVSTAGSISSARIWHACEGTKQMERIESLTGTPRSTFRYNDQVVTFLPESRVAVEEKREFLGLFPYLLQANDSAIAQYYRVVAAGSERIAGMDTDKVQLFPRDGFRYGYRVWAEKETGLVLKLQTLSSFGKVLEEAAFSELQLDVPVNMAKLSLMMRNTAGYRIERPDMAKITALAEGWILKTLAPGFESMNCYKRLERMAGQTVPFGTLQWVFSDGLASVSLFIESFAARPRINPGTSAIGATHTFTRRIDDWWVTVVGEVPPETLLVFAQGLERAK